MDQSPLHKSQRFVEKGSVLSTQMLFQVCESQCFVEKGSLSSPQMSAILKKRVIFSMKKSVERGPF